MKERSGPLAGLRLFELEVHTDERGFFLEAFRQEWFDSRGLPQFIQDNHSRSRRGTLRGLHFQLGAGQAKVVRVARGSIFDVAVDLRVSSPTFGGWCGYELDDMSHTMLYIPVGFAHGFVVLSEMADVVYKTSRVYDSEAERTLAWNDPQVGIDWPVSRPLLSVRDASAPTLLELHPALARWEASVGD